MTCPLCRSQEYETLGRLGRLQWYRCRDCRQSYYRALDDRWRETDRAARKHKREYDAKRKRDTERFS